MPQVMVDLDALRKIVEYMWVGEEEHYKQMEKEDPACCRRHIFNALKRLKEALPESKFELDRLDLINEVYEAALNAENFYCSNIGADLAHLLGAISCYENDSHVDWTKEVLGNPPALLELLREHFVPAHPMWKFIKLDPKRRKH